MTKQEKSIAQLLESASQASAAELEEIYQRVLAEGTAEQRTALAEDCYMDQFSQLVFDLFCGKVSYTDMEEMLLWIDHAATLLGAELLVQEEYIRYYMMRDDLYEGRFAEAKLLAKQCITLSEAALSAQAEEPAYCYDRIAQVHFALWQYDREHSLLHAQGHAEAIKIAAQFDACEVQWVGYLQLLFCDYPELKQWQGEELEAFERIADSGRFAKPGFSFVIVQALHQLLADKQQKLHPEIFPCYDIWLERAYTAPDFKSTYMEILEFCNFFASEGNRLGRLDFIDKALEHITRIKGQQDDKGWPLRFQVECLESKASIHGGEGNLAQARQCIDLARQLCLADEAELAKDFSAQLFYAEFLLRCLKEGLASLPPTLQQIERLALSARDLGRGYNARASLLLVELCLLQGRETEAISYLTQEFLLHELSLDEEVKSLKQSIAPEFIAMHQLLEDFMAFSREAHGNYYLDIALDWNQLQQIDQADLANHWLKRKAEILARPPINFASAD